MWLTVVYCYMWHTVIYCYMWHTVLYCYMWHTATVICGILLLLYVAYCYCYRWHTVTVMVVPMQPPPLPKQIGAIPLNLAYLPNHFTVLRTESYVG